VAKIREGLKVKGMTLNYYLFISRVGHENRYNKMNSEKGTSWTVKGLVL
jgi:hypothetical protein